MGSKSKRGKHDKHDKKDTKKMKKKSYDIQDIEKIFAEKCSKYNTPYVPAIMRKVKEIVVFGDIHGDYETAIEMLEVAKLVRYNNESKDYEWIGNDTYVVQVGDQIDRCRPEFHYLNNKNGMKCTDPKATKNDEHSDIKILELFTKLDAEARKVGGMVISLLGNHELLNAQGYLNYVSYEGLKGFENYKDPETGKTFNNGMEARTHAFKPGNEYATLLGCTRYPAVVIGSNIFVHAGIIDGLIDDLKMTGPSDIEEINIRLRLWLLGVIDESNVSHIIDSANCNSMFWTRVLGKIKPGVPLDSAVCQKNLSKVLDIFHICGDGGELRMMIGHTPQSFMYSDDINSTCGGRIWRVDNGSSKAFDSFDKEYTSNKKRSISRRTQYLKIVNDTDYYVCDAEQCKKEKIN